MAQHGDARDPVAPLIGLTEDALLELPAEQVSLGVGPVDPSGKRAITRAWMEAQRRRLSDALCDDAHVRAIRASALADSLELAAAIVAFPASRLRVLPPTPRH
jgi:hypothetical protein